jgi:steroid delta-isomerase-like uncharacterized protein
MSNKQNVEIAQLFFDEVFNKGNLDVVDQIFAPEYIGYSSATLGGPIEGQEGIKRFVTMYREAFPDIHFEFEDVITTPAQVCVRWTTTGTHEGNLKDITATGRRIEVRGIGIANIVEQQIRVSHSEVNMLSMLRQLDAIQ